MMPTIRVDDEVFKELQMHATPFVDTPNDVLRRLLSLEKGKSQTTAIRSSSRRRGSDSYTSQKEFRKPILDALVRFGGRARMADVIGDIKARVALKPGDFETTQSGAVLWENRAQWERLAMVKEGLLRADSPHGIWQLAN
ncbi:MAG TPA: winged helix-turn-helix domain-containing protein [Dehalococcoidia bacterium]|nr:winged helix-turn-helix domain-containing protein [Dehalococcoidia bacterium]